MSAALSRRLARIEAVSNRGAGPPRAIVAVTDPGETRDEALARVLNGEPAPRGVPIIVIATGIPRPEAI